MILVCCIDLLVARIALFATIVLNVLITIVLGLANVLDWYDIADTHHIIDFMIPVSSIMTFLTH